MTVWDKIYKNYKGGGEAWASLADGIHPLFKKFLEETDFPVKRVLDIGCGIGKYLTVLQAAEFQVDGIDSSEIAVEMTKEVLDNNANILCAEMFDFEIPNNKYDLIISIAAIHHGTKVQVEALINKIHEALVDGGNVFITVPDFESSKKWDTFKNHKEIAPGTFVPLSGPEQDLPHSFFTKKEVEKLFEQFSNVILDLDDIGRWIIRASK